MHYIVHAERASHTTAKLHMLIEGDLPADTCWDLFSVRKIIALLPKEASLLKSIIIGARVAPFSPVGCPQQTEQTSGLLDRNERFNNKHKKLPQNSTYYLPEIDVQ